MKKKMKKKISLTTNEQGNVSFNYPVDTLDNSSKALDLSLNLGTYKFESKLLLPTFGNDFDVQFFPESGVLLNNGLQYIAFKAIGTDGLSREVTGKLYSQKDLELAEIKTDYNRGELVNVEISYIEVDNIEDTYFIDDEDSDLLLQCKRIIHDAVYYKLLDEDSEIKTNFYDDVYA